MKRTFNRDAKKAPSPARRQGAVNTEQRISTADRMTKDIYDAKSRLFSRNRTLFSQASETSESSPRATTHQLKRKRRSLGVYLLGSLVAAITFGLIVYQLTAQISVSLRGSLDPLTDDNQASYQKTLNSYLATRPLERFRGLMDSTSATNYLQQHGHTEVSAISSIDFSAIGKTSIVLEVREPVARWIINNNVQFVDKSGSTFTKNYYSSPHIKIVDNSGITLSGTQAATSGRFLGFIGKSIGGLESKGYPVSEVIIPPSTTRQVQLRVTNNALVKMAIDRSVGEQSEDAARALAFLAANGRTSEYVDVRIVGKAYYK